jgi:hypothetical protein
MTTHLLLCLPRLAVPVLGRSGEAAKRRSGEAAKRRSGEAAKRRSGILSEG